MTAALSFHDVSFATLDGVELLHGISLEVPARSLTVLAGRSGSGKSTLLRLADRLEVPTAGSVRLGGEDIAGLDPLSLRRRVAMVFQRPVVFAGTVATNLRVAAPAATDVELVGILERVGLEGAFLDRIADDLSGGERQRLCIARALLTDPEVVLMDEPTSSLDRANRLGIERLARELVDAGLAVLWVTHDLEQIARIADSTVVLVDGRVASTSESTEYLRGDRHEDEP